MTLLHAFNQLKRKKVLVAGDLLLDRYTIGKASRISPEAPVPVVNALKTFELPGGAGNVILNLISLGAEVVCLGRVGKDSAGYALRELLKKEGVNTAGIVEDPSFSTPIKHRIVADGQQIVRVDSETYADLTPQAHAELQLNLDKLLQDVDAIAISDYGKGFLIDPLLQALVTAANKRNITTIADPKGVHFAKYGAVDILKPNRKEAYAAAGSPSTHSLAKVAASLFSQMEAKNLLITRSEDGISLFTRSCHETHFPVVGKEVKDVTGAGDTVLATLTYCLANKIALPEAITLANIAAGLAIEHFGCARITLAEIAERLFKSHFTQKIFPVEHFETIQKALQDRPYHKIAVEGDNPLSPEFIASLIQMKKEGNPTLFVSMDRLSRQEVVHMAASLEPIDFVLLT